MSKRIIDLQTTSGLLDDDYIMVDGPTNETKKFPIKTLVDDIEALEAGTSLADGAVNTSAIHDAAVTNQKIAANSVSTSNLQNGAVTLEKIASGSDATQLASGLMSSSDKTKLDAFAPASNYALKSEIAGAYIYKGSVQTANDLPGSGQKVGDVYNIISASRYGQAGANVAWNGSGWDTLGETFEIADGVITSSKINDGAVTSSKLAANAVTTAKITDLNVTDSKLAAGSVTESKIGAGAVTATKIGTGAVESSKLATGAVITEKITDGAITTSKIDSKAVNTSKIADYAVDSLQIANNAVTSDKLSSNSVLTAKILDQAVTEGKIANGAVTEGKIANGAVIEGKIGSNAVTETKIANGAVSTEKIADGAVETDKLDDYSVVTAKLGDGAVTTQKIADSNVTTGKLANSAVTTAKIADANVTTAKIADLNVTEGKLANDAVTTDKVADGAITRDKLNEEVTDELDFKADVDGYYTDMTVGAADNLTGRGDTTTAEFLYRTAGGTADIETGQAVAKSVKGNTLVWNQRFLAVDGNVAGNAGTKSYDSTNKVWTITCTNTSATAFGLYTYNAPYYGALATHKTLLMADVELSADGTIAFGIDGNRENFSVVANRFFKLAKIVQPSENRGLTIYTAGAENLIMRVKNIQIFDLTQMFGAGNEPSTVAEFEALFPEPYYEYDAGSLLSVNMEGIETVGFNQLPVDPVYDTNVKTITLDKSKAAHLIAGQEYRYSFDGISGATSWRTLFKVFDSSGKEVVIKAGTSMIASGLFSTMTLGSQWMSYNTNKNAFITGSDSAIKVYGFTPTVDMYMMVFFASGNTSSASVIQNPCLHLVWSGRRNGEYEAFWKSQRLIDVATYFPDGMRSAGTVRDELTSTEAITRVGVVDLGTLTWNRIEYPTDSGTYRFYSNTYTSGLSGKITDIVCVPYATAGTEGPVSQNTTDKAICGYDNQLFVRDDAYTDAATFKTAMSGVMLYYALATPTVTPIDPPLNLSYRVDDFGTERIMVPENERSAPPVLDIAYGLNVVDFVRRAPSEYMSHASFQQFCIALQAKLGIVITETWDDTDNRYEYSIADAPSSNEG